LVGRVERSGVFRWNRKPLKVKALSTLLYYFGLSCRVVARVLRGFTKVQPRVCPPLVQEAEGEEEEAKLITIQQVTKTKQFNSVWRHSKPGRPYEDVH